MFVIFRFSGRPLKLDLLPGNYMRRVFAILHTLILSFSFQPESHPPVQTIFSPALRQLWECSCNQNEIRMIYLLDRSGVWVLVERRKEVVNMRMSLSNSNKVKSWRRVNYRNSRALRTTADPAVHVTTV
jgi:hypothetical protein